MDGSGVFRHHCKSGLGAIFHDARQWQRPPAWQKHGARTRAAGRIVNCAVFVPAGGLEARLYPTNGPTCKRALIHLYITHVAVAEPCRAAARPAASRLGGCRTWNKTKSARGRFFLALPCCGSHPVHQDIQPKPDHVHKMPIPGSALKAKVALGREMPVLQPQSDEEQHQHANEHVETVKTRQHEEG